MAIYHFSAKIISRSKGQSACAAAAYRSGEKIECERTGITYDYRQKQNVEFSKMFFPDNTPEELRSRDSLWNNVENNDRAVNAQLAREVEISIPRELSEDVRHKMVDEFIQEELVSRGMIVDCNWHNPPKMDSKKRPLNASGEVTENPLEYVYDNPHAHIMMTLRPMDENGKWESKKTKIYLCEKNGEQKFFTPAELKKYPGWEKLYQYKSETGKKSWHTESYAEMHQDICKEKVSRFAKCSQIVNPKVEEWNSKETLEKLREAWANKINNTMDMQGLSERVDHRSYERQGVDIIPSIHEGKAVAIAEKKFHEEYLSKIASGENVIEKHTDVRNLNIAIREHNEKVRLMIEIENLKQKLDEILKPVFERMNSIRESLAETLERIRANIIALNVNLKDSKKIKENAEIKIKQYSEYIKEVKPNAKRRTEIINGQIKALKSERETLGVFDKKRKRDIDGKIENLSRELEIYKVDLAASDDELVMVEELEVKASQADLQIKNVESAIEEKVMKYESISQKNSESINELNKERLTVRPKMEHEYSKGIAKELFKAEAKLFDKKMNSSAENFGLKQDSIKKNIRMS